MVSVQSFGRSGTAYIPPKVEVTAKGGKVHFLSNDTLDTEGVTRYRWAITKFLAKLFNKAVTVTVTDDSQKEHKVCFNKKKFYSMATETPDR